MRISIRISLIDARSLERSTDVTKRNLVDVVMRTPAEEDLVGLDVNLVDQTVLNPAILGSAHGAQVGLGDINCRDEDCAVVGELAFVDIDARVEGHWVKDRDEILVLAV